MNLQSIKVQLKSDSLASNKKNNIENLAQYKLKWWNKIDVVDPTYLR